MLGNASRGPQVAQTITRREFCDELGGAWNPASTSCVFERQSDGVQPSCFRAAAQHVFADEHGPCYEFMRLENGRYRQQYRLTDQCWLQLPQFQSVVTNERNGICHDTSSWPDAPGTFIAPLSRRALPSKNLDPRHCRRHVHKSKCEADICSWSVNNDYIKCQPGEDCNRMCNALGGDVLNDECVVPNCRPKVAAELPCN